MSPVGFFVEGSKDKERKIADLRSGQDTRSNVEGVQIPRIDWQGYQEDPIGASLDTFQSVLQGVVNRGERKAKEQRAEGLKVANDLYSAYEAAGIEKNEKQLADEFREQTGISIYAVTRQHGRFVGQATGRIAGRNAASEMRQRIEGMEFGTPAEFDTAYEAEIAKYDGESANDAEKQGFLEIMGKGRNAMTEKVFQGSLLRREKEARDTMGKEVQDTFRYAVLSEDPEVAWTAYGATIKANYDELRASNPSLEQSELESVFINSIEAEINDGMHVDRVDDAVDEILSSGAITTQQGRAKLLGQKAKALELEYKASTDPSPEVMQRLADMTPDMQAEWIATGEFSEKSVKAYLAEGGNSHYAAGRLNELRISMAGISDGTKDAKGTVSDETKLSFMQASKNNDIIAMGKILSEKVMRAAIGDKAAEAWVKASMTTFKNAKKAKLTPARDALANFTEWSEEYWAQETPEFRLKQYEKLQHTLTGLPGESVAEANKVGNVFRETIIQQDTAKNAAVTEIQRIERDGAKFSYEAQTMIDEVDTRLDPAILRLQKLRAIEEVRTNISDEDPGISVLGFGSDEQIRKKENRDEVIQFRQAQEQKILRIKAEKTRWEIERDELKRIEDATQGMTPGERTSYQIWNGNQDGSDRKPFYS